MVTDEDLEDWLPSRLATLTGALDPDSMARRLETAQGKRLLELWTAVVKVARSFARLVSVKIGKNRPVTVDDFRAVLSALSHVLDSLLEAKSLVPIPSIPVGWKPLALYRSSVLPDDEAALAGHKALLSTLLPLIALLARDCQAVDPASVDSIRVNFSKCLTIHLRSVSSLNND